MQRWTTVMVGGVLAAASAWPLAVKAQRAPEPAPLWAASPASPGPDLPPVGRSLFDFVATREVDGQRVYDIPFPFDAFIARVAARTGCADGASCVKAVLIPLGRSLQRTAATPEFFKYPRVVVAVDGEAPAGAHALLKDRFYVGYQEKAGVIEAISWNEAAGRFEFQIVSGYRAGATPRVVYARRALCTACHQGLAPIFSRQVWDETNANPRVAAALEAARSDFYGISVRRGVDIPDAIDAATDRANRFLLVQRLWREACGADASTATRCRAALLAAALQFRLSGDRAFDTQAPAWRETFVPVFTGNFSARWPAGLAVADPDIPNRDPMRMEGGRLVEGLALTHVAAPFEPLAPRPPLEVWSINRPETPRRLVAGLAAFIAAADVQALDAHLASRSATRHDLTAPCKVTWSDAALRFDCATTDGLRVAGRATLEAGRVTGGAMNELTTAGTSLTNLAVKKGTLDARAGQLTLDVGSPGLRGRLADGSAISSVVIAWSPAAGTSPERVRELAARIHVTVSDEFLAVRDALAALAAAPDSALADGTFGRARVLSALFARLGIPEQAWCCENTSGFPLATAEPPKPPIPKGGPAQPFAAFYPLCATCHATESRFPPNFLAGSGERVAAAMRRCAPRIYVRLAMWRIAPAHREKTPMPPPFPSANSNAYTPPPAIASLERMAAELARAETGAAPRLGPLLENGYERLRPCLPDAS
ncbi:MAG: hypothetical protein LJE97_02735 [Betaproteobacteria bacterium]|nr:hypothetical protein [Betaproteobacteria bacterium]